ncbi:phytanoyl-CoA dioxygenase, peroxisomal-like [Plodia interpunctella]|uniref:phytanoyl-CoA dioxygenase, peroxisomal-like n=1 Tax=Plodia interpunctella TaxID=58824 RepID=UPI0023679D13|nr:phytanoyl-CoA dioxygenase, peroxisomal-like [Plodia interpunctella]
MNFYRNNFTGSSKVIPKNVHTDLSQTYEVSAEQRQFYHDKGFLLIKDLIDFESLYNYKKRFVQVCNGLVEMGGMYIVKEPSLVDKKRKPEEYINKLNDVFYDEVFATYVEHPRLLDVLSQFIGDHITAVNAMVINKPPGTDRHPPHQDLFYFPMRPADKIIAAWTAVDHVDIDNGCLYVIPGSHKDNRIYEHGDVGITKKMYHGILNEEALAPESKRVHLEMSPGDTVFFHPLLIHGSGPNVSKNYRKSMTCHFASSSCHYVSAQGTVQEHLAREIEREAKRRGFDVSFQEAWEYRSKQVKGVRSNL